MELLEGFSDLFFFSYFCIYTEKIGYKSEFPWNPDNSYIAALWIIMLLFY